MPTPSSPLGYSLGELTALVATGVYSFEAAIAPILRLADEAASLANDVTLGILFSRGPALGYDKIEQLCLQITNEGNGTIAVSTILSPDTCLLMGQGKTLDRFQERMVGVLPEKSRLRKNRHRGRRFTLPSSGKRTFSDRAAVLMEKVPGGFQRARSAHPVVRHRRDRLQRLQQPRDAHRWVDQPQLRLGRGR